MTRLNWHTFTTSTPPFGYDDEFYDTEIPADRPALACPPRVNPKHSLGEPETLERSEYGYRC